MAIPVDDERYALLKMRFDSLLDANRWQRYRDVDRWPDAKAWWKTNARLLRQADPDVRREMLKAAVVGSFDDLSSDSLRTEGLDLLEDLLAEDRLTGTLSSSEVRELVAAATVSIAFGDIEERAVRFAMTAEENRWPRPLC